MRISRREFLKYCTIAAGALGLTTTDLLKIEETFAKVGDGGPHVVWIPGQACSGCTMSFANSVYYATAADVLLGDVDLDYNEQLVAAAGEKAVEAAISAIGKTTVLCIEGAMPAGGASDINEKFCTIWSRTGGVVAGGSIIQGFPRPNGRLTSSFGLGNIPIQAGDVLKAGSEIVAGSEFPAGTVVASAADRAAFTGSTYSSNSTLGSDVMNRPVTTGGDITTVGTGANKIKMYGGTDAGNPSGSTLAANTVFTQGTVFFDSNDRDWLDRDYSSYTPNTPGSIGPSGSGYTITGTGVAIGWDRNASGGMTLKVVDANGATVGGDTVTMLNARKLSGILLLEASSIIRSGSTLQQGTKVPNGTDQLAIDPSLVAFGFTVTGGTALAATYTVAKEVVLAGDVSIPALPASLAGFLTQGPEADKSILHEAKLFGSSAAAILCIGTCSSFGGIPAATGNKTGAAGALYTGYVKAGKYNGAMKEFAAKTINIPGCPPHADWIVGTIAYLLARSLQALPALEAYGRPMDYFGQYQCNAGPCEWRYNQGYNDTDETNYDNPRGPLTAGLPNTAGMTLLSSSKLYKYKWGNSTEAGANNGKRYVGCIGVVGCKGRKTKADCSLRRWNADNAGKFGTGWCVSSGAGCHGCTEPTFPDKVGKFFNFA